MPRPRIYEKNSDRFKAFRARKAEREKAAKIAADEAHELVKVAEERGFIAVGDVPFVEKIVALREFLANAQEAQLRINQECGQR